MGVGREASSVKGLGRSVLEQMVDCCSEGLLLVDARSADLPVVYVNRAYEEQSGCCGKDLSGGAWPLLEASVQEAADLARIRAAIDHSEPCEVTVPSVRADGTTWLSRVGIQPVYNARGDLRYFLCRLSPVPEHRPDATVAVGLLQRELGRAQQKIANLSRFDSVTGLLRYDTLLEMLPRELGVARRERRAVAILLFEVVELDVYRRTFGDKAADSCLRMIGAQATGLLRRAGDLCARCDDDALVAFVRGQEVEEARSLAARIAGNVRGLGLHNPRARSGHYVSVRFAVAGCVPGADDTAESLLERARAELGPHAENVSASASRARAHRAAP